MADEFTRLLGAPQERTVPPRSHARQWLSAFGALICAGIIALVTLTPDAGGAGFAAAVNRLLEYAHAHGVPESLGFDQFEWLANVAMFIPLGFCIGLLLPRRVQWLGIILLPLISCGIEWAQLTVVAGRVPDARDLLANSLGGWTGVVVAWLLRVAVHARDAKVFAREKWEQRYGKR